MARTFWGVEKGFRILAENGTSIAMEMFVGTSFPGGDAGDQDAAPLGSLYWKIGTAMIFRKIFTFNTTDDWELLSSSNLLSGFRNELVRAATATVAPSSGSVINLTSTPFTDDDAPLLTAANFTVGDRIIYGVGGTPKLMKVTVVSSPNITVIDDLIPLSDNDAFLVRYYLPDSPDSQEKNSLVIYSDGQIIKLGDFNWNLASGIGLDGFVETQGPVTGSDTVQTALQKIAGDASDLVTLSGVARGDLHLGAFAGDTIPDSQTTKQALQYLETALEARGLLTGVTAIQTLDSVLVDKIKLAKWLVHAFEEANPARVQSMEISALHDGTTVGDAANIDNSIINKLKLGTTFNFTATVDLDGAGAAQAMRLRVASTTAGVTVTSRRIEVY